MTIDITGLDAVIRLFDADNANNLYLKRFRMEATKRWQNYIGENPKSKLVMLTDTPFPRFEVSLAPTTAPDGTEMQRPPLEIDAEEFIADLRSLTRPKHLRLRYLPMIMEKEEAC